MNQIPKFIEDEINADFFQQVLNDRIKNIRQVLEHKGMEYATCENRFHNFDVAAKIDGVTRERALWGMFLKHFVSIIDIVKEVDLLCENQPVNTSLMKRETIEEKIGDAINYLILLEAMLYLRLEQLGKVKKKIWEEDEEEIPPKKKE